MAAAVVPNWSQQPRGGGGGGGGGGGFMALSNTNNNRNPNPKSKFQQAQARDHHQHEHEHDADFNDYDDDEVTQTASDDASSINHHRRSGGFNKYVSFNVATYSRKEVAELKRRLLSELDQIRLLKNRIEVKKRPFEEEDAARNKDLMMKNCGQILSKVMKNKYAWIFSKPVDVVALKLHDYYDIIKRPMDLGTVKTNLTKNLYSSPMEFASDVRLTFENAMRYNPKGHEVYSFADQLRSRFEELFQPLVDKMADEATCAAAPVEPPELKKGSSSIPIPPPHSSSTPHSSMRVEKKKKKNKTEPPPAPAPAPAPLPLPQTSSQLFKGKPLKQPKPKARDPNKRDMSMEEKHKLGIGLQSLPQEKMDQVVQIIKKRNGHLKQDGDEIELDIEAVDTETLWELDRLVTNWNKMVSKIKRQALMGNNSNSNIASNREGQEEMPAGGHVAATEPKRPKKGEVGDEDVDIGDDMPMSSFPPVEIEKDVGGNASADNSSSSSGSSTSGSSSSSDSDSGSSSGSDSDNDNAQS